MVPVRQATSWRAVTSFMFLIVSAAARALFVVVSVTTDAQSLVVEVSKFSMVLTFSCQ